MDLGALLRQRLRDGRDLRALVDELERTAAASDSPADRSAWLTWLGQASESLVPERSRALALYRRAWETDPSNRGALDRALALCRELGRLDDLVLLAGNELDAEPDPERQGQLAALVGEALLDLGQRQRAASMLVAAAGQFPESLPIQDGLATVGYEDDWRADVERLVTLASNPTAPATQSARLYLRAARIFRMEAPDAPELEQHLRRALDFDPHDESAHYLLDWLLARAQRFGDLAAVEWRRVEAMSDPLASADLCLRYAFSWSERFRDRERAASWCTHAIDLGRLEYPIAAVTLLRELHGPKRQWRELVELLDQVLGLPLDEEAELHMALLAGTVAWRALGDLPRAGGYFERLRERAPDGRVLAEFDDRLIADADPDPIGEQQAGLIEAARRAAAENPERGVDAWKQAIAAEPSRRAPRRALARLLRATERWRALAEALKDEEAQACHTVDERVSVLGELVAVYRDRLHHDLSTAAALERIVELKPESRALDTLVAHYEGLRRWPEVLQALDRKLAVPRATVAERVAIRLRKTRIYLERLAKEPEAIRELEAALALDPAGAFGAGDVAAELRRLHEKRHEWDKLVALERLLLERVSDPEARLRGAVAIAELAQDKVKRAQVAADAWRAVLAIHPDHERALSSLEQLYEREQDWPRLAEIYQRQAARASDPAARIARLQEVALLFTRRLDDPARAAEAWHALLALEPGHPRAQDALKRFYVERKAWAELEALFASHDRLDEGVRVLERQLELEDEAARVELWGRIAIIYRDRLGKPDRAVRAFEKALAAGGKQLAAAEALIPFYEQAKDLKRLADVLEIQLDHTRDSAARLTRTRRLAELFEYGRSDARTAFRWWLRAFAEDPDAGDARASAERLAGETRSWAELVAAYRDACAKRVGSTELLPLLAVVARAEEVELHEPDAAIASWRAVLELEPSDRAALAALERLYLAGRRYDDLQEIYRRKLELAVDAAARRGVQYQIARLAEEKGDDPRAAAAYQAILATGGDADPELEALDRIYARQGELAPLADVLRRRLQLATGGPRAHKLALELRLAELLEQRLDDAAGAVALYRGMLEVDPEHAAARAALERRLTEREFELEAAAILEPIYQRRGEFDRLVAAREVQVAHAATDERRVQLLHGIAELYERRLGRAADAFAALARALKLDPARRATFDELDRLAEATSAWDPLAQLYKEIASRPLALADQVSVRCRLGRAYRRLGELKRAIATYTRVLDLDGGNSEAQEALARMETMT